MRTAPLSAQEQAALPPIRPRWLAHVAALGGCGLSVGYGWGTIALLVIFPFAAPFVGWALGFRLVRIPYRDWRPSRRQWSTARPVPGTGYHVIQADLDRMEPSVHEATS